MLFNSTFVAVPTSTVPTLRGGLEYANSNLKFKLYANLRSFVVEHNLTYLVRPNFSVGYNVLLDPTVQNFDKYDFGFTWEPATGAFVGVKHESTVKDKFEFGKFLFYFHHFASQAQTIGTEFSLDWQKKAIEARLGLLHKFDDDTSAKVKVNHVGYVDFLVKRKFSSLLTASFATGFSLQNVVSSQKSKTLPLGVQFDLKF